MHNENFGYRKLIHFDAEGTQENIPLLIIMTLHFNFSWYQRNTTNIFGSS